MNDWQKSNGQENSVSLPITQSMVIHHLNRSVPNLIVLSHPLSKLMSKLKQERTGEK